MTRGAAVAIVALVLAAGCGAGPHGAATIWVTRDRGAHVLLVRRVPAGLTAMQGLARVAKIETRYGGRYVQAIDGVEGSLTARHDWFYFINGYEADRSASEYKLHDGDVEWWDFRDWTHAMSVPVVVGAFPEPFLHGFNGKRLPARVVYYAGLRSVAHRLAKVIHARTVVSAAHPLLYAPGNQLVVANGPSTASVHTSAPGDPIRFVVSGRLAVRLASDPTVLRFRYEVQR